MKPARIARNLKVAQANPPLPTTYRRQRPAVRKAPWPHGTRSAPPCTTANSDHVKFDIN